MIKRLLATGILLVFLAMPSFATEWVRTFPLPHGHSLVITITYTESNNIPGINTLQELRSITNIRYQILQTHMLRIPKEELISKENIY
ncbi:MAG: hypothetical protein HW412_2567 [Bacteroidetes bacterium]|nr:hypothetical protein [Bacteroidota bacterium]